MYYKITNTQNQSVCCASIKNAGIQYVVGEYVKASSILEAKGYGPLVFKSLEDVKWFLLAWDYDIRIWECKVRGIRTLRYRKYKRSRMGLRNLVNGNEFVDPRTSGDWPTGTVMVGAVKLTKDITIDILGSRRNVL